MQFCLNLGKLSKSYLCILKFGGVFTRRSDREVTDANEILGIIDKCDVVCIAINDNTYPYIIPVNFGYEFNNGKLTLFFHSSTDGRKHKIIEKIILPLLKWIALVCLCLR